MPTGHRTRGARSAELVADGASDAEVLDWFLVRYGEFVLMDPPKSGSTLFLWLAGPAMLILAGGIAVGYLRTRSRSGGESSADELSDAEKARLQEILND